MNYSTLQSRVLTNFNSRGGLTTIIQNAIADIREYVCSGKIIISPSKLIDHRWSFCFQSTTQATADADYKYDNPAGCIEVLKILALDDNSDWYELDKYTYEQWLKGCSDALASDDEDRPTIWLPRNDEYWLHPVPDAAYTLTLHFYGHLTALSANADEYELEKLYPKVVVDGASWLTAQKIEDERREDKYRGYFEESLLGAVASDIMAQRRGTKSRFMTWREESANSDLYPR